MLRKLAASLRSLRSRRRADAELDDEIGFHIARETEENVRRGMRPVEARRAALVRFGGVDKTKEESREASRAVLFETVLQDVRYGLRSLRKNPGYATGAILTLALGIGANTAIFSVVHGVLLQSLPYGGGDRLVRIQVDAPGAGSRRLARSLRPKIQEAPLIRTVDARPPVQHIMQLGRPHLRVTKSSRG